MKDAEVRAAEAIMSIDENIKVTWAYDSTTRKGIKGEFTTSVLHFSNGKKYRLRPIMMAKENRENIADFFVEQLFRLATAANVSPLNIWLKITAIMTDSVSKNLKIVDLINAKLKMLLNMTDDILHQPLHLLCIIHTVECFDRKMLEVVKKVGMNQYFPLYLIKMFVEVF